MGRHDKLSIEVVGLGGFIGCIDAEKQGTVAHLKELIQSSCHIPKSEQLLCSRTTLLSDGDVLCDALSGSAQVVLTRRSKVEMNLFGMLGMDNDFCVTLEDYLKLKDPSVCGGYPSAAPQSRAERARQTLLSIALKVAEDAARVAAEIHRMPGHFGSSFIRWPDPGLPAPPAFSTSSSLPASCVPSADQGGGSQTCPEMELQFSSCVIPGPCAVKIRLSNAMCSLLQARGVALPADFFEEFDEGLALRKVMELRMRHPEGEVQAALREAVKDQDPDTAIVVPHMSLESYELGEVHFQVDFVSYSALDIAVVQRGGI